MIRCYREYHAKYVARSRDALEMLSRCARLLGDRRVPRLLQIELRARHLLLQQRHALPERIGRTAPRRVVAVQAHLLRVRDRVRARARARARARIRRGVVAEQAHLRPRKALPWAHHRHTMDRP